MEIYRDEALVRIEHVTKRYGSLVAVNDLSLEIRPGEIVALLGPNGAGKTTLIGCTTGLVAGFEGRISIAGYDVVDDYQITRRLVGLVPQELNYDAFFTVRQVLEFQAGYFGKRATREEIDALLASFSLLDKANANTRWLSGGMKRRLMICKALLHDPVLLFLDEPTAGVDVELRDELWDIVEQLRERGTTIVLTTHYIEEAQRLADRVGIINRGRLLRVDARERLMQRFGKRHVEVQYAGELSRETHAKLVALGAVVDEPGRVRLEYKEGEGPVGPESPLEGVMRALLDGAVTIEAIDGGRSSLESIFRELVQTDVAQNGVVPDDTGEEV